MEHTTPPVRLTRRTLLEVFERTKGKKAALENPYEWAIKAVAILKEKLADQLVGGIRYEKLGQWYNMSQILDEKEVELFSKYVAETKEEKSLYDFIPCDSEIEKQFVADLEARSDVKCYLKLPAWFAVTTPVGDYRPDWAVVVEGPEEDGRPLLFLVSETKAPSWQTDLRPDERRKIECAAAHFGSEQLKKEGALAGVDYKVVTRASELP